MKKKLLAILLVLSMIMPASSIAFADSSEGFNDSTIRIHEAMVESVTEASSGELTVKELCDLSGNNFELVETGDTGYYIFDKISGKYLEYSELAPSPYLGLTDGLLYFGPQNYYTLDGTEFVHTVMGWTLDSREIGAIQSTFTNIISISRETPDLNTLTAMAQSDETFESPFYTKATDYYIPSYSYIKNGAFPENEVGSCGYVAACLLLYWWHRTNPNLGIISSDYLSSNGQLKTTGYTLQDKLLSYGYDTASWGLPMRDCLIDYATEMGIYNCQASYYIGKTMVWEELNEGRPVILFGQLPMDPPQVNSRGLGAHGVILYGTHGTYFIANYGWNSSYNCVYIDSGLYGSNTQFKLT